MSKIKRVLVLKDIFPEATYVRTFKSKFQVSSIILTSFRQGSNFTPTKKRTTKKLTLIRLKGTLMHI